jgi:hypothetical protein
VNTPLSIQNRRPRESGDPGKCLKALDSRLRGNDEKRVRDRAGKDFSHSLGGKAPFAPDYCPARYYARRSQANRDLISSWYVEDLKG